MVPLCRHSPPPGNHSSEYLLSIQEFVMFKYLATPSEGICNKISRLVFVHGPLVHDGEAWGRARVLLSFGNNGDSLSCLSLLLQVGTLKE